ncbi:MAG: HEAT repeat domain-containing protein, partial [Bacteroidetes bacterium]|nr:HEAT repeat domain-containing protein [Bacteroidota bacterium]
MISSERKKRGEIDQNYLKDYIKFSNKELLLLINDKDPQKRSVAAKLLGQRKYDDAIFLLCLRLSKEKCLYTKIEISNALANFGTSAIKELIKYIGKIGNNQHKSLPKNIFKKKNYPLPRDIFIRTIIKIGVDALPFLKTLLINKSDIFLSEIIDAIGYITFYSKDYSLLDDIIKISVLLLKNSFGKFVYSPKQKIQMINKQCPKCHHNVCTKDGKAKGKQRY